jgi:hypothetical protein
LSYYDEYGFESGPYLGFPESHDVYGDGSIVIVPAPGHTTRRRDHLRETVQQDLLCGDLVWQLEGMTPRGGSWIIWRKADMDAKSTRETLCR